MDRILKSYNRMNDRHRNVSWISGISSYLKERVSIMSRTIIDKAATTNKKRRAFKILSTHDGMKKFERKADNLRAQAGVIRRVDFMR